ncbi:MAG TPA: von Willebrand factor type A domain-containing protein [Polyangiaceae bacterium]|nr:von Willebrand factor type A domain-containing protein [Polyangiaceae bacterium]
MAKHLTWFGVLALGFAVVGCSASAGDDDDSGPANDSAKKGSGSGGSSSNVNAPSGKAGGAAYPGTSAGGSGGSGAVSGTSNASAGDGSVATPEPVPGDQYEPVGTNPFTLTGVDPLSTFAVDADTASYDIFRRDVTGGVLPDPASVRLEEYVNAFAYHYPAPAEDAEDPFAIHLAASPSLYDTGTLLLRVGIQGKQAPAERGPANLVFLVDVSGSMSDANKLPLVKVVLGDSLDILRPDDKIAIVTYAGFTTVALSPTPVSERAKIESVIDGLNAGGSTAGGAGIELAYDQARAGFVEGGINHVVMCTDGDFNVGISDTNALLDLIKSERTSGVTLTTLGFGSGNLNDEMMEKVSNAGNGMYSVISSEDQAIAYANERMLSTMLHIAKDMKIQVEFNAKEVLAYRLLGYEDRAIADQDFRNDAVDAGEIGVGHRVTALYEVVPVDGAVPSPDGAPALVDGSEYDGPVEVNAKDLVLVKVRYKQPGASESDAAKEVASSLPASAAAASYEELDADFRWAVAIATFAEILKQSPYAKPAELDTIETIVQSDPEVTSGPRGEFATLFTRARELLVAEPPRR